MLLEEINDGIKELLSKVNVAGERRMLKINPRKTKGMTIGNSETSYEVAGSTIENVNQFKYLGSIKTSDANCAKDVKVRAARAITKTAELINVWKDRSMPLKLKVKLVKVLIWPVLMYGCEGWTIRKQVERKIDATEMWIYRRVLRIPWTQRCTNESVLQQLGVKKRAFRQNSRKKAILLWTPDETSGLKSIPQHHTSPAYEKEAWQTKNKLEVKHKKVTEC